LLIRGDLQLTQSTSLTVMPMVFKNTSKMSLQDFIPGVKGTYQSPFLSGFRRHRFLCYLYDNLCSAESRNYTST